MLFGFGMLVEFGIYDLKVYPGWVSNLPNFLSVNLSVNFDKNILTIYIYSYDIYRWDHNKKNNKKIK
jgi:hypothetical protein